MEEDEAQAGEVGWLLDFGLMFSIIFPLAMQERIRPGFFHVPLRPTLPSLLFHLGWFLLLLFLLLLLTPLFKEEERGGGIYFASISESGR